MDKTLTFFISALSTLIIFTSITDGAALSAAFIVSIWPSIFQPYTSAINFVATIFLISIITAIFLSAENFFKDRSEFKYSKAIGILNRKTALIARDIDPSRSESDYWRRHVENLLIAVHDSFVNARGAEITGRKYSISILVQNGDVLVRKHHFSDNDLFEVEESAKNFRKGQGYAGMAWQEGFPQCGGKRKRLWMKDARYTPSNGGRSDAKSFFCTKMCKNDADGRAFVFCIASDSAHDFLWHQHHAENLHYSLQPLISMLEFTVIKSDS